MFHIILFSQFIFCIYFLSFYNCISHFILLFSFFSFEIELKVLHFYSHLLINSQCSSKQHVYTKQFSV